MNIHSTAIISDGAVLHETVEVGPYSIIGDGVTIGKNTRIGPHVVIEGTTTIGENCQIFQFAAIGALPQDLKYQGEDCPVVIGNNNIIREFVTIHKSTSADIARTVIGNQNLIMAYCHVAHNCKLGNGIILANGVNLAGHIHIDDHAIVGGCQASTSSPGSALTPSSAEHRQWPRTYRPSSAPRATGPSFMD